MSLVIYTCTDVKKDRKTDLKEKKKTNVVDTI